MKLLAMASGAGERGVGTYFDGLYGFFELGCAAGDEDQVGAFGRELRRRGEAHAL